MQRKTQWLTASSCEDSDTWHSQQLEPRCVHEPLLQGSRLHSILYPSKGYHYEAAVGLLNVKVGVLLLQLQHTWHNTLTGQYTWHNALTGHRAWPSPCPGASVPAVPFVSWCVPVPLPSAREVSARLAPTLCVNKRLLEA